MSVISVIFILVLMFVIFGIVIWLVQKVGRLFQKWNDAFSNSSSQMPPKNDFHAAAKKVSQKSNSDNLAGKMVRQQNRKSKRQRTKVLPSESNERGIQYSPNGPLFHTRHYRTSHITDDLVNDPHSYRTNNKTYGSKNFDNYNQSKQSGKNKKQTNKKSGKNKTMMDSIADSYAESMKYSEGYQQAVKRSKK